MTLQKQYEQWLFSDNGKAVAHEVVKRAKALKRRGFRQYGIAAIWESIRFDRAIEVGTDAEGYRVNNNFKSRLARDIMTFVPELEDFFETRELRT